jgi:hypothetical protein
MKVVPFLLAFIPLLLGAGCQSGRPYANNTAPDTATATRPHIRVVSIPAPPQLTPTSREGDKPGPIYSSNIIAVYVDTNGVGSATNESVTQTPLLSPRAKDQFQNEGSSFRP